MAGCSSDVATQEAGERLIQPTVDKQQLQCKKHATEVCLLYCDTCWDPICLDCLSDTHKGHNTSRIEAKVRTFREEILQRMDEITARMEQFTRLNREMKQGHTKVALTFEDKLQLLKGEYERNKEKLEEERDETLGALHKEMEDSKTEKDRLQRLLCEAEMVTDTSPMVTVMKVLQILKTTVKEPFFQRAKRVSVPHRPSVRTDIADLQQRLLPLIKQATAQPPVHNGGYVAALKSSVDELRNFAEGKSDQKPSHLQRPVPEQAYRCSRQDSPIASLPLDAARKISSLVGADQLFVFNTHGKNKLTVLTSESNKVRHVHMYLGERTRAGTGAWWYLPANAPLSEAVRLALDYTPVRVTDSLSEKRVDHKPVLKLCEKGMNTFTVWKP